jgi:hypothetical protein
MRKLEDTRSRHFKQNYKLGERAELKALELLKLNYPTVKIAPESINGSLKECDLIDDNNTT